MVCCIQAEGATELTMSRCDPVVSVQAAVRQLQAHVAVHLPDGDIQVIREPGVGQLELQQGCSSDRHIPRSVCNPERRSKALLT